MAWQPDAQSMAHPQPDGARACPHCQRAFTPPEVARLPRVTLWLDERGRTHEALRCALSPAAGPRGGVVAAEGCGKTFWLQAAARG